MNIKNSKSFIGETEVDSVILNDIDVKSIHQTNASFWDTKGNEVLGATALPNYGSFISEEKHNLFGDISGKKVLEIGCGSGHSLKYIGEHKASELWGMDISQNQLEKTKQLLKTSGLTANLVCSVMEKECGIPKNYFDFVYSVYAIGWTTDLDTTFGLIASYLKKNGTFIFSWSHPIHKCVTIEEGKYIFKKCYFNESAYSLTLDGATLVLSDRKMSTYINSLAKAGFMIEQLVEDSDPKLIQKSESGFANKAKMLPVTFVIKARKL